MGLNEAGPKGGGTAFAVLVALSISHLLNDTMQSLIAAVYPWVDAARQAAARAEMVCILFPEAAGPLDGWADGWRRRSAATARPGAYPPRPGAVT